MNSRPLVLLTDAPLDAHTADLLRRFDPSDEVVSPAGSAADALRAWSTAARSCVGRLVIVDSRLHAEKEALANLLDTPGVGSAVLLAHNGDNTVNVPVSVSGGFVDPDGPRTRQAAGILVIASDDCPAFADAAWQRASELDRTDAPASNAWLSALEVLSNLTPVRAVEAAPFCASCSLMDLPASGEKERRLRASAAPDDDVVTRVLLRPLSRRLTALVEPTGRRSSDVVALGLGLGVLAALFALPGATVTSILAGLTLIGANVALLSAGEVARYRRRPDKGVARWHRLASRGVEAVIVMALAIGAAAAGGPAWLLAIATMGTLAVMGNALAARYMVTGDDASDYRSVRWLVVGLVLIAAGPSWALYATVVGSLAVVTKEAFGAWSERANTPIRPQSRSGRFLSPLGVLVDAGIPVRLVSASTLAQRAPAANQLIAGGVAVVSFGALWAWGGPSWPLILAILGWVAVTGLALSAPLRGLGAWAFPPVVRAVEIVVLAAAASTLGGSSRFLAFIVAVGLYFASMETADQWRYLRLLPPAWRPVADLGFDGRMLLIAGGLMLGAGAAAWALGVIAMLLVAVSVLAVMSSRRITLTP